MDNRLKIFFIGCGLVSSLGCAQVMEPVKVVWGSSTRALEKARVDALSKSYRCSYNDCFDAVLDLSRNIRADGSMPKEVEPAKISTEIKEGSREFAVDGSTGTGLYHVFIKDRAKRHIVVMGIAGNVDTTEVGIFFSQPNLTTVKLDVASLSRTAKRKVAEAVFSALDARFSEVK